MESMWVLAIKRLPIPTNPNQPWEMKGLVFMPKKIPNQITT